MGINIAADKIIKFQNKFEFASLEWFWSFHLSDYCSRKIMFHGEEKNIEKAWILFHIKWNLMGEARFEFPFKMMFTKAGKI